VITTNKVTVPVQQRHIVYKGPRQNKREKKTK